MPIPVSALFLLAAIDPAQQAVLDRISANEMRADLSFLASDALEGRDTPSKGLEVASEFIASRFRKAGLEPVAGDSYFQKAQYLLVTADTTEFTLTFHTGDAEFAVTKDFDLQNLQAADVKRAAFTKVKGEHPGDLAGRVAVIEMPGRDGLAKFSATLKEVRAAHPAVILMLSKGNGRRALATRLVPVETASAPIPTITLRDPAAEEFLAKNPAATMTLHARAATQKPVELRNVAGILRGGDAELRDTAIVVSAHYDHIGVLPAGEGDRINNGANDDGSGTVSVIALAEAMARMPVRPKRSILFLCFFGEEKGLFGSRYYAGHPLFPLKKTVAQVNLEQLGRTDDEDGKQESSATLTGFDFTDLPALFAAAGKDTGVRVYDNEKNGDAFFSRSDNQSLADAGVPAHTLAVAFEFPDYHRVGDEWQKIDYANMAKVDRMIALALLRLADSRETPHWNKNNSKTEAYRKAAAQ